MTPLRSHHEKSTALIRGSLDLLEDRLDGSGEGQALATRGWREFLLGFDDAQLDAIECRGLEATWPEHTPASLCALLALTREVCALPRLDLIDVNGAAASTKARRHEAPRKQAQIDAFARLALPLTMRARRVLDVGSGHGHLTREIAARLGAEGAPSSVLSVVGIERDPLLAARARALASPSAITFATTDVVRDGVPLTSDDCILGLHACGELGDAMAAAAARVGAAVVLVGCCLQKRRSDARAPLASGTGAAALPRAMLGLSNLTLRDDGVEAPRAENLAARERRLALRWLLERAGERVAFGAEIKGLNRRAAHLELSALVTRAFASRELPLPTAQAIDDASAWARVHHARARRLQLPRTILARALEVHVLLDRALHLEQRGHPVTVGLAFSAAVSARNLALVAGARCQR